jgi:hypothetical protein
VEGFQKWIILADFLPDNPFLEAFQCGAKPKPGQYRTKSRFCCYLDQYGYQPDDPDQK